MWPPGFASARKSRRGSIVPRGVVCQSKSRTWQAIAGALPVCRCPKPPGGRMRIRPRLPGSFGTKAAWIRGGSRPGRRRNVPWQIEPLRSGVRIPPRAPTYAKARHGGLPAPFARCRSLVNSHAGSASRPDSKHDRTACRMTGRVPARRVRSGAACRRTRRALGRGRAQPRTAAVRPF